MGLVLACASGSERGAGDATPIQLGPRPFFLLDQLAEGPLRTRLDACRGGPFRRSRFSIAHRGAPLQFPEHSRASYLAAARMGAGMLECDVSWTADRVPVCRHAECDLAQTTDILTTPLADHCREPFVPARFDTTTGRLVAPAQASCCTSDLTLTQLKGLDTRMEASDRAARRRARSAAEYQAAIPTWRTQLYTIARTDARAGARREPILTFGESLVLAKRLGLAVAPELKAFVPGAGHGEETETTPFDRDLAARQLVDALREHGFSPRDVRLQSFDRDDIRRWLAYAPAYGARAIWLIDRAGDASPPTRETLDGLYREGFRALGPPISLLLRVDERDRLRASGFARRARDAGFELIGWTLERSGRIHDGRVEGRARDFYLDPVLAALRNDGDVFRVVDALAREVGVVGLFSDWPATTTFYANCLGLD